MSTQQKQSELTDKERQQAAKYNAIHKRIEETAPIYDVEYQVNTENERDAVMKAHGMLSNDLSDHFNVPTNTTFDSKIVGDGKSSVMITVAVEAKRSVFKNSEVAHLVDPRSKHWLWCVKEFKTDETVPVLPDAEDGEWEYEDGEMEMLQ